MFKGGKTVPVLRPACNVCKCVLECMRPRACQRTPNTGEKVSARYFIQSAVDVKEYHRGSPEYFQGIFSHPPWLSKSTIQAHRDEKIPPGYFFQAAVDGKKYLQGIFSKPPWMGKNTTEPFCAPAASMIRRKVKNTVLGDKKYLGYKKYLFGLY